jgi:hypothetical protein
MTNTAQIMSMLDFMAFPDVVSYVLRNGLAEVSREISVYLAMQGLPGQFEPKEAGPTHVPEKG